MLLATYPFFGDTYRVHFFGLVLKGVLHHNVFSEVPLLLIGVGVTCWRTVGSPEVRDFFQSRSIIP